MYGYDELIEAEQAIFSTLNKVTKALISLEEKQSETKNLSSQITLSRRRKQALVISLALIQRELHQYKR